MKHLSKLLASLALLTMLAAFVGCSNPNSSDNSGSSSNSDATTTDTPVVASLSGTYRGALSGNTATCTVTVGEQNFVVYATTSDIWATIVYSGFYEGTMTKE